jgi:hypothetical protein
MTFEEFDTFFDELMAECRHMRTTKGKEYAHSSEDRFANFKRIAERKNVKPALVASIYLQKHMDGIESFINTGVIHSTERVRGRIVDAITYLGLIAGILHEEEMKDDPHEQFKMGPSGSLVIKSIERSEGILGQLMEEKLRGY